MMAYTLPIIERLRLGWPTTGLVFVGAGERRAVDTRAYLARHQDGSWSPLPVPGATAETLETWMPSGVRPGEAGE
jgi:hypothetical protein